MLLNRDRLNELMVESKLDAVIATSPENVTYSSGYWALSQWIRRGPQTYVVLPGEGQGEAHVIANAGLLDLLADQEISVRKIVKFGNFVVEQSPRETWSALDCRQSELNNLPSAGSAGSALAKVLSGIEIRHGRIAVDEGGLPPRLTAAALPSMNGIEFLPGFELMRHVRAVKMPEEIERLRKAAHIAEMSIDAALAIAAPGVTEAEMAQAFNLATVRQGGLPVLYCIGTGTRSAMPNVQPSDRKLEDGDIIRFDVGGRYKHYRADIARNAVLGEPNQKVRTYYEALWKGVQRGLEMLRPGTRAADVFNAVVQTVRREGIPHYARTHVGHGIGLDGYDLPELTPDSNDVLEEGMVLCVETPYYELGFGGLQVEDMVAVGPNGPQSLMQTSGKLRVLS